MSAKNRLFKSGKNYLAPVGFLPEPDLEKSARFRPEPKSGTALLFTVSSILN